MGDQKKESESGSLFEDKDLWLLFKDADLKKKKFLVICSPELVLKEIFLQGRQSSLIKVEIQGHSSATMHWVNQTDYLWLCLFWLVMDLTTGLLRVKES